MCIGTEYSGFPVCGTCIAARSAHPFTDDRRTEGPSGSSRFSVRSPSLGERPAQPTDCPLQGRRLGDTVDAYPAVKVVVWIVSCGELM
jgi:hypothetical protein